MFRANPRTSLRTVVARTGVARATVYNVLRWELKMFSYELQIGLWLSEADKNNRLSVERNHRRELRND